MDGRCDIEGCSYRAVGVNEGELRIALARHEEEQHPVVAEAVYITENPRGREGRVREDLPGCICRDVYDLDCPAHWEEAVR